MINIADNSVSPAELRARPLGLPLPGDWNKVNDFDDSIAARRIAGDVEFLRLNRRRCGRMQPPCRCEWRRPRSRLRPPRDPELRRQLSSERRPRVVRTNP